jgi:hypothetical protein
MRLRVLSEACIVSALTVLLLSTAGCHVQVQKGKNGEDKNVKVDTPFGGLHVRSDQTSAADLGLPVYPGAQIAPEGQGDKSADVHMGFGQFQLRVKVVTYTSPDPQDKVLAYYKKAMGTFGDVIECDGNQPVGTPSATSQGLTCKEEGHHGHINVNGKDYGDNDSGLSLRAGSRHHQHIVAFKSASSGTRYSMIELQIPTDFSSDSNRSSD